MSRGPAFSTLTSMGATVDLEGGDGEGVSVVCAAAPTPSKDKRSTTRTTRLSAIGLFMTHRSPLSLPIHTARSRTDRRMQELPKEGARWLRALDRRCASYGNLVR